MPTIKDFRRRNARRLRNASTDAEKHLWHHLRRMPMIGSHFRRQVPIGVYVADFACMAARVVIEIDGSQHGEPENKAKDEERTRWLMSEGYRVVRFWNNEVFENIDGVLEMIRELVESSQDSGQSKLTHTRHLRSERHPTPARCARRPSPSRGG